MDSLEAKKYWVAFNLVKGIGSVRFKQILDFFGDLETAWESPASGMVSAGLPAKVVENLVSCCEDGKEYVLWSLFFKYF